MCNESGNLTLESHIARVSISSEWDDLVEDATTRVIRALTPAARDQLLAEVISAMVHDCSCSAEANVHRVSVLMDLGYPLDIATALTLVADRAANLTMGQHGALVETKLTLAAAAQQERTVSL